MIEDEIFASALEASNIKRTKKMYTKAKLFHECSMCGDRGQKLGYKLKVKYVDGFDTPYELICKDCYNELKDE